MRKLCLILLGIAIGVLIALPFRSHRDASTSLPATGETLAERELDRVVPVVDFEEAPFDRAVAEIQQFARVPISVDWTALKGVGVDRNTPVTVHSRDIYLWQVLDRLTINASQKGRKTVCPIGCAPRGESILISTKSQLGHKATAWLYDVQDLAFQDPPPPLRPAGGMIGPWYSTNIEQLTQLIEDTVAPESWVDSGGAVGTVFEINNRLYIVQDWLGHRKIRQLLRDLRDLEATPLPMVQNTHGGIRQTWISPDLPEAVEALIRRPIDQVEFNNVPFEQAVERLQKMTGVAISVNWKALADENVFRTSPLSMNVKSLPLPAILEILFIHGINGVRVSFAVENGFIEISTPEDLANDVMTRLYDVRDFVAKTKGTAREEVLEKLIKTITDTVAPDSWRDNGGTIGSIREFRSQLIITQSWPSHDMIAALFEKLRQSGSSLEPTTLPTGK